MKSLQVLTPNRDCMFNCPFCISKMRPHHNEFINQLEEHPDIWESNYKKVLLDNVDLKTIVITGTNEPLQDPECIEKIVNITRKYRSDIQIELQTRYYKDSPIFSLIDVVAFSISNYSLISKIHKQPALTRGVVILTDSFNHKSLEQIINQFPFPLEQLTFKILQDSKGEVPTMDTWIKNHRTDKRTIQKLKKQIKNYQGPISIFFDENCMEADNRYMVFREDGKLYHDFTSIQ